MGIPSFPTGCRRPVVPSIIISFVPPADVPYIYTIKEYKISLIKYRYI
jgi:hypothetical protein